MIRAPFTVVLRPLAGIALLLLLLASSTQAAAHWHTAGDSAEQHCSQCLLQDAPGLEVSASSGPVAYAYGSVVLFYAVELVLEACARTPQARAPPFPSR